MMQTNELQKPDNATLILRRVLNAPQELAFKVWTSPEHIQFWMKPEPGMTTRSAKLDLRVGGRFRIQMQDEDGEYFTAAGVFQEVTPPGKLVYTWDWEKDGSGDEFGELEGNTTEITVEFIPRGAQTEMFFTHTRFATTESRDNHARGWGRIIDTLADYLEKQ
ncbi:SRPBCC domain-containing protein [Verrucomicrobium sp. BvORR106]|uniref:SRPBCC family protein n=1 Tax=Verrucomicrobium sp. BvORR106 TaxID=1403819 RepID=UPI002240F9BD|nr:SRPBCC domain-containing protein [Verrucomicrobium sp. BvORR106]